MSSGLTAWLAPTTSSDATARLPDQRLQSEPSAALRAAQRARERHPTARRRPRAASALRVQARPGRPLGPRVGQTLGPSPAPWMGPRARPRCSPCRMLRKSLGHARLRHPWTGSNPVGDASLRFGFPQGIWPCWSPLTTVAPVQDQIPWPFRAIRRTPRTARSDM
jgi:hypothetical protein